MRLAANDDAIHGHGAEVIAISTDDEVRQAGMYARWPTPHIRYVADPGGETYLQPLGLFSPDERDGIAAPGVVVIAPDGTEVYRYRGRDFADRTTDEEVFAAVASLGLDPIEPPAGGPVADVPDDLRGCFRPDMFGPYFRGNRFSAVAIASRLTDEASRAIAIEHREMCDATLDCWARLTS